MCSSDLEQLDAGLVPHRPDALLLFEPDTVNHLEVVAPADVETKLAALLEHRSQLETTHFYRLGDLEEGRAIEAFKQLDGRPSVDGTVRLGALVALENEEGATKVVFIGPLEGGLKITHEEREVLVITPASPLGRELLGKTIGEGVKSGSSEYEILRIV